MQVNDFAAKKRDLDAHVKVLQEQLLFVEDKQERQRLYSVLDELLAEKMQIDDYMEKEAPVARPFVVKKGVPVTGPVVKTREVPVTQPKMYKEEGKPCGQEYPEIRDVQLAKLCEIERGKLVRMCAPSFCPKIAYRWCIYYGQNKKGEYVLSEADRTVKRIEEGWGQSLFCYAEQTKFWTERKVFILDDLEGKEKKSSPCVYKDKLRNIAKGKLVKLWEKDWAVYQGKKDKYHLFIDEKSKERKLDLSFSGVDFYYKDKVEEPVKSTPPLDKLENISKYQIISLHSSLHHPEIGNRWCNYYGKNKRGEYVVSEADTTIKRLDSSWGDKPFHYMEKPDFWKQRTVPISDEMFDEVQKALNSHTDKDMYAYLGRDDKGEAKSFSSLHEDYKKMLDEMRVAEAMTVSEKELSKRRKGKEKADEERITLPEKVVLFEAHDKRLDDMWREEDTGPNEKEERSLAALAQVGEKLKEKFAKQRYRSGAMGYALALLKEIKIGSLVRLIGPPRVSVENFWSTYLGVDEQGYPVLQDERKRHRIDKDYLKKEWAYQDNQVENRVVELREACALGSVDKVRKLLQAKFMLDGTHLCMALQSANVEILNLLHEQSCPYNKHTLSDFCGRSTVQVYDWLKEHGYSLTKQVLISASKSCNTALLEMFWSKVN